MNAPNTPRGILTAVKQCIRNRYAWPSSYALLVMMHDGATLCPDCARAEYRQIARATRAGLHDGWRAAGTFIHWEGAPEHCAHCDKDLPSEYGECN